LNQLDLLRQQFGEVLIPPAVLSELKADTDFPGADRIRQALAEAWLHAHELTHADVARVLAANWIKAKPRRLRWRFNLASASC
jgi:hypothetical protein